MPSNEGGLGINIAISVQRSLQGQAGGVGSGGSAPAPTEGPFMDFSDETNSMYVALLGDE